MRIERLHIEGFGHFSNCDIGPFDRPATILSGPNEAGKSTLLAFIRMILFGFPRSGRSEYYPPLAGGRHGGRIELVHRGGARTIVERLSGPRGGNLQIISGSGEPHSGEAELKKLLGHASRAMFNSVFAFDLDELTSLRSLNETEVSGRIYSAGMGASRLPGALKDLEKQRDKLFKTGSSKSTVTGILQELRQIEEKLDAVKNDAAEFQRLAQRRQAIGPELEAISAEVDRLSTRRAEMERLQEGWNDWIRTMDLEECLKRLPTYEGFPADGPAQLKAAEERLERERRELTDARQNLEAAEREVSAPLEGERLLEDEETIESLRRNLGRFEGAVAELVKRRAELHSQQEELDAAFRDLGPGWDEARLASFNTSLPVRKGLEDWGHRLSDSEQVFRQARSNRERAESELEDAQELAKEARHKAESVEPPPYDATELDRRRGAARNARRHLDDYRLACQRLKDLQQQMESTSGDLAKQQARARRWRSLWIPTGVTALAVAVAGVLLGGHSSTFGLVIAALLLVGASHLFLRRHERDKEVSAALAARRDQLETARHEELRARKVLEVSAVFESPPDRETLDTIEASLDDAATALDRWSRLQEDLDRAEKEKERRRRRSEEEKMKEGASGDALRRLGKDWLAWLAEHGLDGEDLTPPAVIQVFVRVEKTQLQLKGLEDTRRRVRDIEREINEYRSRVVALAQRHAVTIAGEEPSAVTRAAEHLGAGLDRVRDRASRRQQVQEVAQRAKQQVEARERHVAEAEERLLALLHSAGAPDPDTFRQMADEHAERRKLEEELRLCATRLRQLSGPGEAYDRFRRKLSGTTPASLEERARRVAEELETAQKRKEQLLTERGSVQTEIARLADEATASELRARRAIFVEKLRTAAREWSVFTLAHTLLEQSRSRYERERQPGVLKSAQQFFKTVTGGAYTRILSPLGSKAVTVIAPDGSTKIPEQLSRGTREQLYLALRFGLIRQFAEQETSLPVIVDEVLVNFDSDRARRAARGFAELARTNQVLVFTCHPSLVELFTEVDPEAKVIELNSLAAFPS